jgi:hypothetical protein
MPAPTREEITQAIAELNKKFIEFAEPCQFRSTAEVGIVRRKTISVCGNEAFDSDDDPMFLCLLNRCPLLFK